MAVALTVALASVKGGVGKTSAAVNLAALAAGEGRRTLLWDLDPQGAATYALGVGARVPGGARRLTRKRPGVAAAVTSTAWPPLDVIPADFSLRHLDLELADLGRPRRRLAQALDPVADGYDLVVIDCPPGINLTIDSVLRAADVVLVPVVPSVLPLRAYDQLAAYVAADRKVRKTGVFALPLDGRPSQAWPPRARRRTARPTVGRALGGRAGVGPRREHATPTGSARGQRRPERAALSRTRALWGELQARGSS